MHIYRSILVGSLLVTSVANNSLNIGNIRKTVQQSNSIQQKLLAQEPPQGNECSTSGQSPLPGCGRT
jgi:hypothetical protein